MSLKTMASRIQYAGGDNLQRIQKQKLRSFQQALKNDYQTRMIKVPNGSAWPALINSYLLKSDYDRKIISVEHESGLQAGDTFQVLDDGSHWMVFLPFLTETAYLRSEIIRCRYNIELNGKIYWIYFQGPTETDLRWFIKRDKNINELNLSGTVYIKEDDFTKEYFKRFTKMKLDGHVWEVQVTDSITVPGIIELEVQEYYDNIFTDLPEVKFDETTPLNVIKGLSLVKQDSIVGYSIDSEAYDPSITWKVEGNPRVEIIETFRNNRFCKVKIHPGAVRDFTVRYGEQFLPVTIDWQKPRIDGPCEVYPFETHKYRVKNITNESVKFAINSPYAKIADVGKDYCLVEILSSKKADFTLKALVDDTQEFSLEVQIKSL